MTETTCPSPLVGVIVPCFNQGVFAPDAIASLHAQTYPHWTAVLVDDASTDRSSAALCAALSSDRVKVTRLARNQGRALVRNEALARLPRDTRFVLVLDCDDVLSAAYIEQLVTALLRRPEAGFAYGLLHYASGTPLRRTGETWPSAPYSPESMYLENRIPGPGVLFRREALADTAGWRADFSECSGEDFDIWLQVVEAGWEPLWVRDACYYYRQHAGSFLASSAPVRSLYVALDILKHHRTGIRENRQMRLYVRLLIRPHVVTFLRQGDFRPALECLRSLLCVCPATAIACLAGYYGGRAKSRLSAIGRLG